ncbi:MAG TPA: gliding motility-associated protein GldE [Phnomibacter sp.]|nr:gliding motility-associated protein GldE [Phnomibacter sp.]
MESISLFTPALSQLIFITTETGTALGLLLLLLLFISFCASGAEVAFFSLSYKDINHLKTKTQPSYRRIVTLLETPKILLGVLLIANSFANIGIIFLSNHLLDQFLSIANVWLQLTTKILIVAAFILLFGEILPKTFAAQNNIRFAKDVGIIVEGLYLLFNRLSVVLVGFSDSIEKKMGQRTAAASIEELNHAIDLTSEEDATEKERNILKGILKFGNITVKQVMKARLDVSGLEFKSNFAAIKHQVEELHYSRLPVYHVSLDEVKGIIHTKDLLPYLHEPDDFDWHQLMRPAHFVHEQKLIEDLMQEFQAKRVHFAVVVDEFGGTSGIITMEDILEEIIGEITDEFDDEESGNKKLDDLNYIFEGKTMLNDVCRIMNLSPDTFDEVKGESDSLAGLILEVAGEIPTVNKVINVGDFDFTIMEVAKNRIQKIKVSIRPSAD